jgi:hypothetical protein
MAAFFVVLAAQGFGTDSNSSQENFRSAEMDLQGETKRSGFN